MATKKYIIKINKATFGTKCVSVFFFEHRQIFRLVPWRSKKLISFFVNQLLCQRNRYFRRFSPIKCKNVVFSKTKVMLAHKCTSQKRQYFSPFFCCQSFQNQLPVIKNSESDRCRILFLGKCLQYHKIVLGRAFIFAGKVPDESNGGGHGNGPAVSPAPSAGQRVGPLPSRPFRRLPQNLRKHSHQPRMPLVIT
jgi:hypothetical protein